MLTDLRVLGLSSAALYMKHQITSMSILIIDINLKYAEFVP